MDIQEAQEEAAPELRCENCGIVLHDRFCSHCGQDSRPFQRSLGKVFAGFTAGLFDIDGKVLKSIIPLLLFPGRLTNQFLEGKRRSQVNPFQLYAFFSFIFFFTTLYAPSFLEKETIADISKKDISAVLDSVEADSSAIVVANGEGLNWTIKRKAGSKSELAKYDSLQSQMPEERRDPFPENLLMRRFYHLADRFALENRSTLLAEMWDNFKSNIPNILILLLPVFAFLLKLLYLRSNLYFVDHLVFSIHQFCFVFLLGTLLVLSGSWLPDWAPEWILIGLIAYFILAMKRVYLQSYRRTIFKFGLISFFYSIILVIALAINIAVAAFFQT
jgi:hypothetical protein